MFNIRRQFSLAGHRFYGLSQQVQGSFNPARCRSCMLPDATYKGQFVSFNNVLCNTKIKHPQLTFHRLRGHFFTRKVPELMFWTQNCLVPSQGSSHVILAILYIHFFLASTLAHSRRDPGVLSKCSKKKLAPGFAQYHVKLDASCSTQIHEACTCSSGCPLLTTHSRFSQLPNTYLILATAASGLLRHFRM